MSVMSDIQITLQTEEPTRWVCLKHCPEVTMWGVNYTSDKTDYTFFLAQSKAYRGRMFDLEDVCDVERMPETSGNRDDQFDEIVDEYQGELALAETCEP